MNNNLKKFNGYLKSRELYDHVVEDMSPLTGHLVCRGLVAQQVSSADSICANIEEGYGRGSSKDYTRFLFIARGSAQETRGRYERMKHWISNDVIEERVSLCEEIIGILTTSVKSLRS